MGATDDEQTVAPRAARRQGGWPGAARGLEGLDRAVAAGESPGRSGGGRALTVPGRDF